MLVVLRVATEATKVTVPAHLGVVGQHDRDRGRPR